MWEASFLVVSNGYRYNNFLWKCDSLNKDFKRYGNGWNRHCRSWYDKFDAHKSNNDIFLNLKYKIVFKAMKNAGKLFLTNSVLVLLEFWGLFKQLFSQF